MQIVEQLNVPIKTKDVKDRTVYEATTIMQKNTYDTYDSWIAIG